jgi:hypothetical protein
LTELPGDLSPKEREMAFDSRDVMISLPSGTGEVVGYQLTCRPLSPAETPPDDKGKPKPPNCPQPSCQNSTRGPKPGPVKPGPKRGRGEKSAAGLLALRQQLRQTLAREM